MAFRGQFFTFHGSFASKAKAEARERARKGTFIRKVTYRRKRKDRKPGKLQTRYMVLNGGGR